MNDCFSTETLEQFLAGTLGEPEASAVRTHLAHCPSCQKRMDDISDNPALRSLLAVAAVTSTPATEPVASLLDRLRRLPAGPSDSGPALCLGPPREEGDLGSLGPYRILAELGRGGMGVVLRGYDEALRRTVAVKVLRADIADDRSRARLVREARLAAQLRHDHLVPVYAVLDPPDGLPCLVMEYVPGLSLAQRAAAQPPLPPHEAARLVAEVADALEAAHAAGLVHRDVKPGNVLIDAQNGRARLTDFGLALDAAQGTALTREGAVMGTPAYMSPEQVRGEEADARSDVYGLGATLYEALTGEPLFHGSWHMVLRQVLEEEPRPPRRLREAVPRDLETVCLKALAKEPDRRYQTASELGLDLRRFLAGEPIHARPVGALERGWRWCRRNPRLAIVTTALAVVFLAGLSGVLWEWRRAEASAAVARTEADEAEHNLREALAVIDRYLVRVSEHRLLNEAGMQPLRRELLETASGFLRRFVEGRRDDHELRGLWASCVFRLAGVTLITEGPRPAIELYQQALAAQQELLDEAPDDVARRVALGMTWNNLGIACERDGQEDKAEDAYGKALAVSAAGGEAPGCQMVAVRAHINQAKLLTGKGQLPRQIELLRKAQQVCEGLSGRGLELPESRRGLGICCNNLGALLNSAGRFDEAEQSFKRAVAVWEEMERDDPKDLAARVEHGRSLGNLLRPYLLGRRWPEATDAVSRAAPVATRLARENPSVLEVQIILANTQCLAGMVHQLTGQSKKALAAYEEALTAIERVTRENPHDPGLPTTHVGCELFLANLTFEMGHEQEAIERFGQIERELEGQPETARMDRLLFHINRALAHGAMGRATEAAEDWRRAQALDPGIFPNLIRCHRVMAEARLAGKAPAAKERGMYEAALAEMARTDQALSVMPSCLYQWAMICSLSSTAALADDRVSERHAAAGVALLRRVAASGYFRAAGRVEQLKKDRELDALRSRGDFQALVRELESP